MNKPNLNLQPSSELILNPDGSIYHLHLLPQDIADTILLVGDPERVAMVSKHFDSIEIQKQKREFITHTGWIGKKRITVISTGIGTDNIDIVLNELDALANIDLQTGSIQPKLQSLDIIRIGTSGAIQPDIALDSCVVSAFGLGLDNLLHQYEIAYDAEEITLTQQITQQLGLDHLQPYVVRGSDKLLGLFNDYRQGITATCSGFYGPQGRKLRAVPKATTIINKLSTVKVNRHAITNFEMETSGIFGLAKLLGHHAISVNAIVANRVTQTFSSNPNQAVEETIKVVLAQLSALQ